jgi:hypothetical protein
MVLDWETTADERQAPLFLIYELHGMPEEEQIALHREGRLDRAGLDRLFDIGVVYDPDVCTPEEIRTIERWAWYNGSEAIGIMDHASFVDVFYRWAYHERALVIGHNLAFDLSRFATAWGPARGDFRGGFRLKLCTCGHDDCFDHPALRIKHIGRHKNLMAFSHVHIPGTEGTGERTLRYKGRFLDTATLARALLGPGSVKLADLGHRLRLSMGKLEAVHGQVITPEYLDYCRRDVAMTWAVYQELKELYRQHGTRRAIWSILSEASISKAYLDELGFPRCDQKRPTVPNEVTRHAMQSFYGGRTQTNIRLQPTEGAYLDFASQYPMANALQGLQDLFLARRISTRTCTSEVRRLLSAPDLLEQLQRSATWRCLRCLVRVRPNGDILPFRGKFGGVGVAAANIALCHVTGPPKWYPLADVVAAVLLSGGKVPEIEESVELVPRGRVRTRPWRLFGHDRYTVDPRHDDVGVRLVELRREVKAELETATSDDEGEYLDSLQRALKIVASSASYGVLLEVNADERTAEPKPVTVYHEFEEKTTSHVVEKPGPFFAAAIGTIIPAGGRLLLALAERLGADRGLSSVFCDTDSMFFARPDDMERDEFERRITEIADSFAPLSPYRDRAPIFEMEPENYFQGRRESLYCLAVSPKRYVLYNRLQDGTYRIRKLSAHGTASWEPPDPYEPPAHIPDPVDKDGRPVDPYKLGGPRWLYDQWYGAIELAERGETHIMLSPSPALEVPAMHQVTISTWQLYEQFRHVEGLRPFNFITVLPPLGSSHDIALLAAEWENGEAGVEEWEDWCAARKAAEQEWRDLRKRIMAEGGIRRTVDVVDMAIPSSIVRRNGLAPDDMASHFGYAYIEDFLSWVWKTWERSQSFVRPRHSESNPYRTITPDTSFYSPYGKCFADVAGRVHRSDTGDLVEIKHRTMADCLADYFQHPNYKVANPRHVGPAARRHVEVAARILIGRETNRILEELEDESEGVLDYPDAEQYGRRDFGDWLRRYSTRELATRLGLSERQVKNLRAGAQPSANTRSKIDAFLRSETPPRHRRATASHETAPLSR